MGLIMNIILSFIVVSNIVYKLYINRHNLGFIITIWKEFSIFKFLEVVCLIAAVILSFKLIVQYIPVLKWGWLNLLNENGGSMNFIIMNTARDVSSTSFSNAYISVFLLMFILAVPFLSKREEEIFRKGHHTYKEIIGWSFIFGFIHLTLGIPIVLGFSLTLTGLFLSYKYHKSYLLYKNEFREEVAEEKAILNSTVYHSLYNTVLMVIILVSLYT